MNTLKGLSLTALLIAGSMSFIPATQANTEAPTQAPTQALSAPIEAPLTALTYPSTSVTTSPAPAPVEAPISAPVEVAVEAPTQAPVTAPTQAPVEAPVEVAVEVPTAAPTAPTAAPIPAETWNTSGIPLETWKNVAGTDPYSGNPIVDCAALGMIAAEDYSCVPASFYSNPTNFESLELGDAWAGVGTARETAPLGICLDVLVPKGTPGNYCYFY